MICCRTLFLISELLLVNDKFLRLLFHASYFNPLVPSAHKSARIVNISIIQLKGIIKNFEWASRLWVGRRKRAYVPKNAKKNWGSKGIRIRLTFYVITSFFFLSTYVGHVFRVLNRIFLYRTVKIKWNSESYCNPKSLKNSYEWTMFAFLGDPGHAWDFFSYYILKRPIIFTSFIYNLEISPLIWLRYTPRVLTIC